MIASSIIVSIIESVDHSMQVSSWYIIIIIGNKVVAKNSDIIIIIIIIIIDIIYVVRSFVIYRVS